MKRLGSSIKLVLLLVLLILGVQLFRKTVESRKHEQRADTLYSQAKTLEEAVMHRRLEIDSLQRRIGALTPEPMSSSDIRELQERGLEDPVPNLIADLQKHLELIPYPGLEGLKMGFYDTDGIRVLNNVWVYAPFEDGHIGGDAILAYNVAPGGKITWRLVTAQMGD
jgi:hypothetical protein